MASQFSSRCTESWSELSYAEVHFDSPKLTSNTMLSFEQETEFQQKTEKMVLGWETLVSYKRLKRTPSGMGMLTTSGMDISSVLKIKFQ